MDGVLTDSEPLTCTAAVEVFKNLGLEVQRDDFNPFIGTGEDSYLSGPAKKYGLEFNLCEAKAQLHHEYLKLVPAGLQSFPGVTELIDLLRSSGVKIAVATSADEIKMDANLAKIGHPPETWDACAYGGMVKNNKPSPDIFLKVAELIGADPLDCAVIEDSTHGIDAANRAGCLSVAVGHTFSKERLSRAQVYVEKISDLTLDILNIPNL